MDYCQTCWSYWRRDQSTSLLRS